MCLHSGKSKISLFFGEMEERGMREEEEEIPVKEEEEESGQRSKYIRNLTHQRGLYESCFNIFVYNVRPLRGLLHSRINELAS
jgi:hypothetical protein